jgi:beta-carotene 3-hydroxylase
MHGFLWTLHKDHHNQNLKTSWWERNDLFFVFYAVVSMLFFYSQVELGFQFGFAIGFGIMSYGLTYFIVHDIFIHQRFKVFRNTNNHYAKALRRAHKIHHKHLEKNGGECFGMLWVPLKYLKK